MFDKWKAKRALVKAFKFYRKEYNKACKHYYHTFDTEFKNENYDVIDKAYDDMKSLKKIMYALAYVLYSNFNMFGWEDGCWIETYYDLYKYEGKEYVEQIRKTRPNHDYIAWSINDFNDFKNKHYIKGDRVYCVENGCIYMYDGKNFIEMG